MSNDIREFRGEHRFLSNFYESTVWHDGIEYPTVEHAYQAAKTLDFKERKRIADLRNPGDAKRAGRKIAIRSDWEGVKYNIMYELVLQKFTTDLNLRARLSATGRARLIEGNHWHDNIWGDCTCNRCDKPGLNALGLTLMTVRSLFPRQGE